MTEDIKEQLIALEAAIDAESKLWEEEIGAPPGAIVQFDAFLIDAYIHTLAIHLIDKGILDEDELTLEFRKQILQRMQAHRPGAKQAKMEALRQAIGVNNMQIPKSKPRNPFND